MRICIYLPLNYLSFPESMCKPQYFKDLKHSYVFPGCPTNYEGIAVAPRKAYQVSGGGRNLAGETNVCSFIFLHGRPI